MKARLLHTIVALLLALLQAGSVAALPAAEICSAAESSGACTCGMECCATSGPSASRHQVIKESPCCTIQEANPASENAIPSVKTSLPAASRVALESIPSAYSTPAADAPMAFCLCVSRIPSVTTASIPLLNSSLLI